MNPAPALALLFLSATAAFLAVLVIGALVSISLERRSRRRRLASLAEVERQAKPGLIVVLGCPPRTREGQPSRYLLGRASAAAAAFHRLRPDNGDLKILCSGRVAPPGLDADATNDELVALTDLLGAAQVPSEAILRDPAAARTIDTIDHLADHHAAHRLLIVTQPFHLPRALYLARSRRLEAWGLTAPGPTPGLRGELREGLGRLRAVFDVAIRRRRR